MHPGVSSLTRLVRARIIKQPPRSFHRPGIHRLIPQAARQLTNNKTDMNSSTDSSKDSGDSATTATSTATATDTGSTAVPVPPTPPTDVREETLLSGLVGMYRKLGASQGRSAYLMADGSGRVDGAKVLNELATTVGEDEKIAAEFAKTIDSDTLGRIEEATKDEQHVSVPDPGPLQLWLLAFSFAVSYAGFGFVDNFVMIAAGDVFDATLCVYMGLTTLAAAGLGNLLSDLLGLLIKGIIEDLGGRVGVPDARLSPAQMAMRKTKIWGNVGSMVGVTAGCVLGMCPLLWLDTDEAERLKHKKKRNELFAVVNEELAAVLESEQASMYLLDPTGTEVQTKHQPHLHAHRHPPLSGSSRTQPSYTDATETTMNVVRAPVVVERERIERLIKDETDRGGDRRGEGVMPGGGGGWFKARRRPRRSTDPDEDDIRVPVSKLDKDGLGYVLATKQMVNLSGDKAAQWISYPRLIRHTPDLPTPSPPPLPRHHATHHHSPPHKRLRILPHVLDRPPPSRADDKHASEGTPSHTHTSAAAAAPAPSASSSSSATDAGRPSEGSASAEKDREKDKERSGGMSLFLASDTMYEKDAMAKTGKPTEPKYVFTFRKVKPQGARASPYAEGLAPRQVLCAPLIGTRGELIGMVEVLNKVGGTGYTASDARVLRAVCSHLAIHLEEAKNQHVHQRPEALRKVFWMCREHMAGSPSPAAAKQEGLSWGSYLKSFIWSSSSGK
ncbi:unnamed protein product [Vitrella brassicaformis CCMP3155]|uniref:GAF domain-containing protein n=4 Tax=Vitrella brassicaformis TaxID=1169539 RepID=A0A0G4FIW7_VITBC|nr:unnamed protein product [Vitrella brassicaformis CCMP3155]|eukprot:CEM13703.1 unnamed protein product [Vitrella brassicaformis CCMP3155]